MRETHEVCRGGCRSDDTFRDFYFVTPKLIVLWVHTLSKTSETYGFGAQIHSPSRQRKPAKKSFRCPPRSPLPTTTATPAPAPYFRNWGRAIRRRMQRRQPRSPLMSMREFTPGRYGLEGGSQRCECPLSPETPAAVQNTTQPRSVLCRTEACLRVEWQHGVERQRNPNRTHLPLWRRWISGREVAKERGNASQRMRNGIWVGPGPIVDCIYYPFRQLTCFFQSRVSVCFAPALDHVCPRGCLQFPVMRLGFRERGDTFACRWATYIPLLNVLSITWIETPLLVIFRISIVLPVAIWGMDRHVKSSDDKVLTSLPQLSTFFTWLGQGPHGRQNPRNSFTFDNAQ